MSVNLIKVEADQAVETIDNIIVQGYQAKDEILAEYKKHKADSPNTPLTPEQIQSWQIISSNWVSEAIRTVKEIFISLKYAYNLRDKSTNGLMVVGMNADVSNIVMRMQAKIDLLNEYSSFLSKEFNINYNVQIGNNNTNEQS